MAADHQQRPLLYSAPTAMTLCDLRRIFRPPYRVPVAVDAHMLTLVITQESEEEWRVRVPLQSTLDSAGALPFLDWGWGSRKSIWDLPGVTECKRQKDSILGYCCMKHGMRGGNGSHPGRHTFFSCTRRRNQEGCVRSSCLRFPSTASLSHTQMEEEEECNGGGHLTGESKPKKRKRGGLKIAREQKGDHAP